MWMVRAGRDARFIEGFLKKNIIAIGWETKDLSVLNSQEEVKEAIIEAYPNDKKGKIAISVGQVSRFRFDFARGDKVITSDPNIRSYHVGEIIGDYEFNEKLTQKHFRKVKWIGTVSRDDLSTSTKNTLGAISTIFNVGEYAADEIIKVLKGEKKKVEDAKDQEEELDSIKDDMIAKAQEFIKDKILSLDWDEMQELVAGVLRAMGYKTRVSPPGADRGRDIQASPDGLGLEEPRIFVEVKHRLGQIGAPAIRSFTGGLRQGNKGLYVSTGGFSKDAKYEAERSTIPVTLIDADELGMLIVQYYDSFDSDTRTLIPLVKIYWPA
ncbi:MAG: restriction endonuclease [Candidatus Omnitrophica bacterium]|nr:restriction endonuclease [Candidatus Omnitrophota bacterium]